MDMIRRYLAEQQPSKCYESKKFIQGVTKSVQQGLFGAIHVGECVGLAYLIMSEELHCIENKN